jgi:hypothetical protein
VPLHGQDAASESQFFLQRHLSPRDELLVAFSQESKFA